MEGGERVPIYVDVYPSHVRGSASAEYGETAAQGPFRDRLRLAYIKRVELCHLLTAVTPAYEEAVLHYLATGEPWEAGPAPVIGDPLYSAV